MTHDARLVTEGAAYLLAADEYDIDCPPAVALEWARKALGIGEELIHDGDCTKKAYTCRLCQREIYERQMRAVLNFINASGTHRVVQFRHVEEQPFIFDDDDDLAEQAEKPQVGSGK